MKKMFKKYFDKNRLKIMQKYEEILQTLAKEEFEEEVVIMYISKKNLNVVNKTSK